MNTVNIRFEIHQMVSSISALDTNEQEHINFATDWIKSGSEIFRTQKPATPDTHLVSYFVVASTEMDKVLLVDHKKAELWLPPGGHVEPGENPKKTVRREAKEELGIGIKAFVSAIRNDSYSLFPETFICQKSSYYYCRINVQFKGSPSL
jgi:8-oxo-dGTP pyrophosphatase MutT (NUDIX family)